MVKVSAAALRGCVRYKNEPLSVQRTHKGYMREDTLTLQAARSMILSFCHRVK